jgi:hypothetical protein
MMTDDLPVLPAALLMMTGDLLVWLAGLGMMMCPPWR